MLKDILRSAALAAGLAIAGQGGDAQAVTVSGLYSLNGGVVTPLADADPDPERFIATQTIGNLTFISLGHRTMLGCCFRKG